MGKVIIQTLVENRKKFLRKNENFLEKVLGNFMEIGSNRVKNAIMRMRTGTPAGPGDIPVELIKLGGQKLLEMITILLNKILNGEKLPEEWNVAIIT